MPWKETCAMNERLEFVADCLREEWTMSQLCRDYGISRKTGYKWLGRFLSEGCLGLQELSRARHNQPRAVSGEIEEAVLEARAAHPFWGPRKLRVWLGRREPATQWPCASTIGEILKRHGLTVPRRKRRHATPQAKPMAECQKANQVWCADFKGWFRTGDGTRCTPLTITDGHTRFILRCQAMGGKTGLERVRPLFEATFREFGLPEAIRTDNGTPFASTGLEGLSRLSVWWIRLGIRPDRIRPGKPQDNGRHERMHRTLKQETAAPPKRNLRAQQKAFDRFRGEFNHERPHEALDYETPASLYAPSPRSFPRRLPEFCAYPDEWRTRKVKTAGRIKWGGREICVSQALVGERIGLEPLGQGRWLLHFGPMPVGVFDERKWIIESLNGKRRGRR